MAKVSYEKIADYFIALSNETGNLISHLKLQKLMYYAQAWHLVIFDEKLFEGDFEAWVHGPVLSDLYQEYKSFKWRPIEREDLENEFDNIKDGFDEQLNEFMESLCKEYFGLTAYELERLTHSEDPWINARKGLPNDASSNEAISNEDMKKYYSKFLEE